MVLSLTQIIFREKQYCVGSAGRFRLINSFTDRLDVSEDEFSKDPGIYKLLKRKVMQHYGRPGLFLCQLNKGKCGFSAALRFEITEEDLSEYFKTYGGRRSGLP